MSEPFLYLSPRFSGLAEPLCADIELLDGVLGAVLEEQEGGELLLLARRLFKDDGDPHTLAERMPEITHPPTVKRLLRAFTTLFQLLNTAEQKEIVRVNRERQTHAAEGTPRAESIAEAVERLAGGGATAAQMQTLLNQIGIVPTLTAHPTEARRRAVQDKLQTIALCLAERMEPADLPYLDRPLNVEGKAEQKLRSALTALWQTDELRASPITVEDEARNALYFFERTILDVVTWLHDDLKSALAHAYPGHLFTIPPFLRYRSWVGGDRDGNPNVTPEVTWQTLISHRRLALTHYRTRLENLRRELTQSGRIVEITDDLRASLERDAEQVSLPDARRERFTLEPYGLKLLFMAERLGASLRHLDAIADMAAEGPGFAPRPPAYADADEFIADLRLVQNSLRANRAGILADEGALAALVTQAETFGFHLAALDIRQHSREHEKAVEAILAAALVLPADTRYADMPEEEKNRLLTRELLNPRPLLGPNRAPLPDADPALRVFEVIRLARRYLSPQSVTTYIISMTHGASDILEPMLLAKEAGLLRWRLPESGGGDPILESDLDFVPLFETIDDLTGSDTLMRRLFANRAYRLQIATRHDFQEIMLGYSDSSKDGGYLAANWALHDTQARLAKVCREADVTLQLFHGRGGTVGRGGGRANRAIQTQPPGSFNGRIRFTEQGEVISFRYSLPPIAHRHLEQIVSATLLAASPIGARPPAQQRAKSERAAWHETFATLAAVSRQAYREMVHEDPEFWPFYTQATPIAHISRLPIASRPVSRSGKTLNSVDDLRAIPWVFAWVQSRYLLPGWYGVGTALETFAGKKSENLGLLQSMYADWPFFRTVLDSAQLELLRAHLPTAAWYAQRVQPARVGQCFHDQIAAEFERTRDQILRIAGRRELLEHAPVVRKTVELRNPAVLPLSRLQVSLLDQYDRLDETGGDEATASAWRDAILLSITGIAAAMQSTG